MKSKYIISILLFVMGLSVLGQTVETPWGTTVNVYEQNEMPAGERYAYDTVRARDYPNAIFHVTFPVIPTYPDLSSTRKFNCHGYAWHMYWFNPTDDLDDPYNMGNTEATKYFTNDPSFKECVKADADIWWINSGSHSAVATGVTDQLKSKWDDGPLATHDKDESPYTINTVKYYKKCYREVTGVYDSDITLDHCKVQFNNTTVYNYVDLEIEYEDWVLIEGTFTTGTGATLYIHPD